MTDELSGAIDAVKAYLISFIKFVSPNDAGSTGGHQAGLYIPKNSFSLIFEFPGVKGINKERFANIIWFDGTISICCFKYYGYGTRNEYRITRLGKEFLEGQLVVIVKKSENHYLGFILKDDFTADSFLEAFNLTRDDANTLVDLTSIETFKEMESLANSSVEKQLHPLDDEEDSIIHAGIPTFEDLMEPTFLIIKALGGVASVADIQENIANTLKLSNEDLSEIHKGTTTKLSYRLAWARNYLKRFGLLENLKKGFWKVTPRGFAIDAINKHELQKAIRNKKNYNDSLEFDDDFVEVDKVDEEPLIDIGEMVSPFDPKDIKIIVEPKTIDHLVARLRNKEIDMNTEFQRKGNLWSKDVQSRLIESILLRLPLPPFYFDADDDDKWLVVDGLQRLWTIKNFIVNTEIAEDDEIRIPLVLTGLEILTDYSDKNVTYDKLNRTMKRRILETPVTAYLIQPGTPKNVKYNVFRRINSGGLALNAMEIRNALNQGTPSDFLLDLSEDRDLRTILKLQDKRMDDRELLLRAYAFINESYLNYTKPLSGFLDTAMESLATKGEAELVQLANGMIDAIFFQVELFGKHIFSRSILGEGSRVKLNSALFEVWVSEIYKLSPAEKDSLYINRNHLISDYKLLLNNEDFNRAVATSTSGRAAVKTRFESIQDLIKSHSL
ncbi:hypothetical protein ADIARSV_3831 [Arcticibacter svalbardensis MN12-7]|uniref:DUF262 domain-containing protein n=1 Tax=Arcticibacter svalbardensis MN12-7 TaxID=1150600 RepID=R9GMU6_9SPHI|nr:DUF262 domain-containing protein [Arcticibacter svalbardensis]EOR93031.1 hypothetical protein ADIARSV_3831 [Arcticibacter svalbardensis MN12-7]